MPEELDPVNRMGPVHGHVTSQVNKADQHSCQGQDDPVPRWLLRHRGKEIDARFVDMDAGFTHGVGTPVTRSHQIYVLALSKRNFFNQCFFGYT